jgi:hypothetical protein
MKSTITELERPSLPSRDKEEAYKSDDEIVFLAEGSQMGP